MNNMVTPAATGTDILPAIDTDDKTDYLSAMKNHSLMGLAMISMEDMMLLFTELANTKFEQMSKKVGVSRDAQDKANAVDAIIAGLEKADSKAELTPDIIAYMRENNILVGEKTIDEFLGNNSDTIMYIKEMLAMIAKAGSGGMKTDEWQHILKYMDDKGITVDGKKAADFVWESVGFKSNQYVSPENMQKVLRALEETVKLDKGDLMMVKSALESVSGRASDFVQQNQLKLQQLMQNFNTSVTMANSIQSMNAESNKSIAQSIR